MNTNGNDLKGMFSDDTEHMDEPGTTEASPPGRETPQMPPRIGKFVIDSRLGKGGFGEVFLGHDEDLDREVVVKRIRPDLASNPAYVKRFLQEGRTAAKVDDPNVVRVYDAGKSEQGYYMAMEYVPGGNALDALEAYPDNAMPWRRAAEVVLAAARAMAAYHAVGIIHRDIKPENILLARDGKAKLADFGIAKRRKTLSDYEREHSVTAKGMAMGSPNYLPPEQVSDAASVDIRADIYALGATFYRLVTGCPPFSGNTVVELMERRKVEDPRDPREICPKLPVKVAVLIRKMMARSREDRYQSPEELVEALESIVSPLVSRATLTVAGVTAGVAAAIAIAVGLLLPPPIQPINELFVKHDYVEVIRMLTSLRHWRYPVHRPVETAYCVGLAHLNLGENEKALQKVALLEGREDGKEWGAHLKALAFMRTHGREEAEHIVKQWTEKARKRLPFLASIATLQADEGDLAAATRTLRQAVKEQPFLAFQRTVAVDSLARMLVNSGNPEKAAEAYNAELQRDGSAGVHVRTNYAMALWRAGKTDKARQQLDVALSLKPGDELVTFLQEKLRNENRTASHQRIRETLELITEVSTVVSGNKKKQDYWTSPPNTILVIPVENHTPLLTDLATPVIFGSELTEAIHRDGRALVVDRESFEHLLREQKINASSLSSPEQVIRQGRILPASILVKPILNVRDGDVELSVRIVDAETSEFIDVVTVKMKKDSLAAMPEACTTLNARILDSITQHRTPRARIVTVREGVALINNGKYHGLRKGQKMAIYESKDDAPSAALLRRSSPMATVTVAEVDRFTAVLETVESRDALAPGLLVIPSATEGR